MDHAIVQEPLLRVLELLGFQLPVLPGEYIFHTVLIRCISVREFDTLTTRVNEL